MNRKLNARKTAPNNGDMDRWLLTSVMLLVGFGLIMVLSSSGIMAERFHADKYFYFKKQAMFAAGGLVAMYAASRIPRRMIYGLTYFWVFTVAVLLVLCGLTPLGVSAGGASRWLSMGPINIQPMEFAKPALVIYLAYFFAKKQDKVKHFSIGFLPPFVVTGLFCLLLMTQPDFGGAVFLAAILFFMCMVGGTRLSYLVMAGAFGAFAGWQLIASSPYRLKRWTAFLDPFASAQNEGYQLVQSLYAFGSGGLTGQGLGAGKQKLFFLPEAHNDFIMAVAGEELGFIGLSLFFILVGFFLFRAFRVSLRQEDLQDRFTAFGMTLILALGFVLNLAVVLGTVPPKGVAMPFISYGGSSMLASLLCAGMLLNISREASK